MKTYSFKVLDIQVQVTEKNIKSINLSVRPPEGHVTISVPSGTRKSALEAFVGANIANIRRAQRDFENQPRQTKREYVGGETHYFLGGRYLLDVVYRPKADSEYVEETKPPTWSNAGKLTMYVQQEATAKHRGTVMLEFYKVELGCYVADGMLQYWESKLGFEVGLLNIRRMKTAWATASIKRKRITLNSELAKKRRALIQYALVSQMVQLMPKERQNGLTYQSLMDMYLPEWHSLKKELNDSHLASEVWI